MARRVHALVVLVALLGSLGLPWVAESHQFNDDPHWAVSLRADDCPASRLTEPVSGDDTHCEVCHWLRTMRSADRPSAVSVGPDVRPQTPPVPAPCRAVVSAGRLSAARAPPAA